MDFEPEELFTARDAALAAGRQHLPPPSEPMYEDKLLTDETLRLLGHSAQPPLPPGGSGGEPAPEHVAPEMLGGPSADEPLSLASSAMPEGTPGVLLSGTTEPYPIAQPALSPSALEGSPEDSAESDALAASALPENSPLGSTLEPLSPGADVLPSALPVSANGGPVDPFALPPPDLEVPSRPTALDPASTPFVSSSGDFPLGSDLDLHALSVDVAQSQQPSIPSLEEPESHAAFDGPRDMAPADAEWSGQLSSTRVPSPDRSSIGNLPEGDASPVDGSDQSSRQTNAGGERPARGTSLSLDVGLPGLDRDTDDILSRMMVLIEATANLVAEKVVDAKLMHQRTIESGRLAARNACF